jgi:hypothetical protein
LGNPLEDMVSNGQPPFVLEEILVAAALIQWLQSTKAMPASSLLATNLTSTRM